MANFLEKFGRAFVPEKFREPLWQYLFKAGYSKTPYTLFGVIFILSLITTYIIFFTTLLPVLVDQNQLIVFLGTLGFWIVVVGAQVTLAMFFIWVYLNLKIYSRTQEIEDKLPDYLELVITNLRSGMSLDRSLFTAIRPEFGVLGAEIGIVSKKVMTGNDTVRALQEFGHRYDSPIVRRSIDLIVSEVESGGQIADVIERVTENIRKTRQLKNEMRASVVSYMIFISMITVVIAPVLFALAQTILSVIISFAEQIASGPDTSQLGGGATLFETLGRLAENKEEILGNFYVFGFFAVGTISLFAGVLVSILEKGDIRGGLKYIPVFVSISLIIYLIATAVIGATFGGMVS